MYILKLSFKDNDGVFKENEFFSGFGDAYLSEYEIFDPVLESEVNSIGHFSFTVYPSHPLYEFVDKPKSLLEIISYGKNEPLFIGRMAECQTGMYNEKMLTFESELSFLLDSIRTNFVSNAEKTAKEQFKDILSYHNDHSDSFGSVYTNNIRRKFQVGKVSDSFNKDTFTVSESEFSGSFSTLEIISKLFLEKYGGVLKIRHENGVNLIDWLDPDDIPTLSQKIVLSENLLDIQKTKNVDELVTAIRPIGENVDDDNGKSKPLDLKLYNASTIVYDRSGDVKQVIDSRFSSSDLKYTDTLYSDSLVKKYGWIQREVKFDGVTGKAQLSREAVKYLLGVSETESITVNAVDLAFGKNELDAFMPGDFAIVNSNVHGMNDRKMMISGVRINLSDPTQSEITLGNQTAELTSQIGGNVSGVSFSGGISGGTGRYDPEGSANSALMAAKKYTDEKTVLKADKTSVYTKDETDSKLLEKADKSSVYTKSETDSKLSGKVDKVSGMGLSQESFTTTEKSKLAALSNYNDTAVKADIAALKSGKANKSDVYTKTETDSKITSKVAEIVSGAPEEFDTLKEMSDWIADHKNSAAAMNSAISGNRTLITELQNEFSIAVDRIDEHDSDILNLQSGKADKTSIYTKTEIDYKLSSKAEQSLMTELQNEFSVAVDRLDGHDNDISGLQAQTAYMADHKLDTVTFNGYKSSVRNEFSAVNDKLNEKVDKVAGKVLSSNDYTTTEKEKLAGIAIGANKTVVDTVLSATSTNPVQNKVVSALLTNVNSRIDNKADLDHTHTEYAERDDMNNMYQGLSTGLNRKADLDHTHKYAGSSSAGGAANSAEKLATARTINGVPFDGSSDIKIRLDTYVVSDSLSTWGATPWHKIASCEITNRVTTRALTLYVERTLHPRPGGSGILRAIIRSGNTASVLGHAHLNWEYANSEINPDNFVLVYNSDETSGKLTAELWAKINSRYETWQFKVLSMGETTVADIPVWTMYNLGSGTENYPESTGVITSSLMGIKNNVDTATNADEAYEADHASTADYADYAGAVSVAQECIYSLHETKSSPLTITVNGLFTNYKLLVCNMTTSGGQISCMLPMGYIKSLNESYYLALNYALFKYVDDNTMTVYTGLGQINPTINKIELIAVY